jgi:hypothetical protein
MSISTSLAATRGRAATNPMDLAARVLQVRHLFLPRVVSSGFAGGQAIYGLVLRDDQVSIRVTKCFFRSYCWDGSLL